MTGDRSQARSVLAIRREAGIQLGLSVLALASAASGTCWPLQGRLHPIVWPGVAGALTLAGTFLSEGRRVRNEYTWPRRPDSHITAMKLAAPGTEGEGARGDHGRGLLALMVFGIVASVGGPGLNVLLRILTRGGAGNLDLLAWVLLTLPVALAVWMLPPRGLARRTEEGPR